MLAVLAATLVGASTVWFAIAGAHPLPYWDAWEFVEDLRKSHDGTYGFADLVRPANEHRIALPRLLFFLDAWLGSGSETGLVVLALAMAATLALLVARCATNGDAAPRGTRVALAAGIVAIVVSGTQMPCLAWSFGVQFQAHSLLPTVALALLVRGEPGWAGRVAIALCGAGATFSIASSLLFWPFALALAAWLRRTRTTLATLVVAGAACWWIYFRDRAPTAAAAALDPLRATLWSWTHLGGAWQLGVHAAPVLGALGAVLALHGVVRILRRRAGRAETVLSALAALWVLYSLATGVGRWTLGREEALAGRYAPGPLLFWAAVLGAHWRSACAFRVRVAVASAIVVLVALLCWKQAKACKRWFTVRESREVAALSLLTGELDAVRLGGVYPVPALLGPRVATLRELGLSIFADRSTPRLGEGLEATLRIGRPSRGVPLQIEERVDSPTSAFVLVTGLAPTAAHGSRGRLVITDAGGTVRGLGSWGWGIPREWPATPAPVTSRWFALVPRSLPREDRQWYLVDAAGASAHAWEAPRDP